MKKPRPIDIFLVAVLLFFLMISNAVAQTAEVKPPSELIFGARVDAAPLSSRGENGWEGYSIDLCLKIFDRYKTLYKAANLPNYQPRAKVEFDPVNAAERMDKFIDENDENIDILCGATTVTIKRMQHVNFSLMTFVSGTGIMKKTKTDSSVLVNPGAKQNQKASVTYVGCTDDMQLIDCTTTEEWVNNHFASTINALPKPDHDAAFKSLSQDEAMFYVGDRVILEQRLKQQNDSGEYQLAPIYLSYEPYALPITKSNPLLLQAANETLAELYRNRKDNSDNSIDQIYGRYFKERPSALLDSMYKLLAIPK